MKAPTYILKRVHLERDEEREFINHEKRLKAIENNQNKKIEGLRKETLNTLEKLDKSKLNHQRAQSFHKQEQLRETFFVDKSLVQNLKRIEYCHSPNQRTVHQSQDICNRLSLSVSSPYCTKTKKGSYPSRKEEEHQQKIEMENISLANKMIKLPPIIDQKKLEKEYQTNKNYSEKILKFHQLKRKKAPEYSVVRKKETVNEIADNLDPDDEELMNQRVQLYIGFTQIDFSNFVPRNSADELYLMEIKSSIRESRFTTPETYDDFSKSVINEFFYIRELRQCKMLYIGLIQLKDNRKTFLGDFEIDMTPLYLEGVSKSISLDLRNYKQLATRPSYMPTDMRRKGGIEIDLKITSKVKQYLLDSNKIHRQYAPQMIKISSSQKRKEENI